MWATTRTPPPEKTSECQQGGGGAGQQRGCCRLAPSLRARALQLADCPARAPCRLACPALACPPQLAGQEQLGRSLGGGRVPSPEAQPDDAPQRAGRPPLFPWLRECQRLCAARRYAVRFRGTPEAPACCPAPRARIAVCWRGLAAHARPPAHARTPPRSSLLQAFKTSPNPEQVERLSARGGGKGLGEAWASLWTAWDSQE